MIDKLEKMLGGKPFAPFRIVLASGPVYDVIDRHQLAIGATQLAYYFPASDRKATLPLAQIARYEVIER